LLSLKQSELHKGKLCLMFDNFKYKCSVQTLSSFLQPACTGYRKDGAICNTLNSRIMETESFFRNWVTTTWHGPHNLPYPCGAYWTVWSIRTRFASSMTSIKHSVELQLFLQIRYGVYSPIFSIASSSVSTPTATAFSTSCDRIQSQKDGNMHLQHLIIIAALILILLLKAWGWSCMTTLYKTRFFGFKHLSLQF
jgi:hypothetical protein